MKYRSSDSRNKTGNDLFFCLLFSISILLALSACGNPVYMDIEAKAAASGPKVTALVVNSGPSKTEYVKGEDLDLSGLVVTATWDDGSTGHIGVDRSNITGYNKNVLGEQTCSVSIGGKSKNFPSPIKVREFIAFTGADAYNPGKTISFSDSIPLDLPSWASGTIKWSAKWDNDPVDPLSGQGTRTCTFPGPGDGPHVLTVTVTVDGTQYQNKFFVVVQ